MLSPAMAYRLARELMVAAEEAQPWTTHHLAGLPVYEKKD